MKSISSEVDIRPSPRRRLQSPFGKKRQRIAVLFLAIGLASLFEPLIEVSPSIMNRTRWSPMGAVLALIAGDLTHSAQDVFIVPAEVAATYLLFVGALAVVSARRSSKAVLTIGVVASVLCSDLWGTDADFQFTWFFYGQPTLEELTRRTSVDVHQLAFVLSLVSGVLVFVSLYEDIDGQESVPPLTVGNK